MNWEQQATVHFLVAGRHESGHRYAQSIVYVCRPWIRAPNPRIRGFPTPEGLAAVEGFLAPHRMPPVFPTARRLSQMGRHLTEMVRVDSGRAEPGQARMGNRSPKMGRVMDHCSQFRIYVENLIILRILRTVNLYTKATTSTSPVGWVATCREDLHEETVWTVNHWAHECQLSVRQPR